MKCEFVKNFNAAVNFTNPEKRRELAEHIMVCGDCQEYVNAHVGEVLQRASPQDVASVIELAEEDKRAI